MGETMDIKVPKEVAKPMTVYVWDMDETLILFKSLLDGTYAAAFDGLKDTRIGVEIGKRWENHILQVCDEHFFYEEIENYNEPFLRSLSEYDDGQDLSNYDFNNDGFCFPYDDSNKKKLAYRHRLIAQKYSQVSEKKKIRIRVAALHNALTVLIRPGLNKVLDQEMIKLWNDLYNSTDNYTDGWLSSGHALLEQTMGKTSFSASDLSPDMEPGSITTKCQNINVLVTSGALIPSLAKCLLYRLDDVISANNVYSSWEVGKLQCFSWIKERFGSPNVRFCAIGDGPEECEAAQAMRWPFIKIDLRPSSPHRFPGLNMTMVRSYIDVIYGAADADAEEVKE